MKIDIHIKYLLSISLFWINNSFCFNKDNTTVSTIDHGILVQKEEIESTNSHKLCLGYFSDISNIVTEEKDIVYSNFNLELWNLCEETPSGHLNATFVFANLTSSANCSIIDQALTIKELGGIGTIFVGGKWPKILKNVIETNLTFGFISNTSYHLILNISNTSSSELGIYSEHESKFRFRYNVFLITLIAQFSIMVGAYWSGTLKHKLYLEEEHKALGEPRAVDSTESATYGFRAESSIQISPKMVMLYVLLMCLFLVTLWFLLKYLVYIIIAMFCLASFCGVYSCFEPMARKIPFGKLRTPYFNIYIVHGVLEIRQIVLLICSASLPIVWFVCRKMEYAWMLQDFLGICFCINVMRVLRLPNLMICTLLLVMLVIYDVFFVYITPYITSTGTSIMVDVAKGGGSNEELPLVLKVPYFTPPEYYAVCQFTDYSILGFGDILVPGLLISLVHSFDLKFKTPFRIYYVVTCIGYFLGLILTYVALYVMKNAQPALFFLIPTTLIPTVIIAAFRNELAPMWKNRSKSDKSNSEGLDENYDPELLQNEANFTSSLNHSGSLPSSQGSHRTTGGGT